MEPVSIESKQLRDRIAQLEQQAARDREQIANLEVALTGARRIGAALGILMVTRQLTQETAFDALRDASQKSNRKLRDVAEDVLHTGQLPIGRDGVSRSAKP